MWSELQQKRKLFNDKENINIVDIYIQDTLVDFYTFSYKTFSEGYKQHYDRSVKGILSEPTRRFPHMRVV